ncbi:MAG: choice-of-anchor B family protein [Bacteroidia bacterium]
MKKNLLSLLLLISTYQFTSAQTNLSLAAQLTYPGISFAGCWHYVDNSFNEYALVGASDGVRIINITNPTNPVPVASVPGEASIWRELKTYGHYAYVSTEAGSGVAGVTNGLQIIDLSGLPGSVNYKYYSDSLLGSLLMRGHTVTVADNGFLYVSGTHLANGAVGGVLIFSLTDPWNPVYVGQYTTSYVHDCIVYNDTMISSELGNGFSIVDVSNKATPVVLQTQPTPANFNHNTWRSDNGNVLFTTDEVGGAPLGAYDISDIANIKLLDIYYTQNMPNSEVHNVRVINDFLICPSYGSQVTIVDAARPANLIEVGEYPTSGNLCWDADPYFPSGKIVACDMNGNIYVLTPNYIRACYLEGIVTDSATGALLNNAAVQVSVVNLSENTNLNGEYKTGTVTAGTYTVTVSLTGYNTKIINNVQLNNGVLTTLNVQLSLVGSGINDIENNKGVFIAPNPVTDKATFVIPFANAKAQVKIYDALGKLSQTVVNNYGTFTLHRNDLNTGMYFFEVMNDEQVKARGKFIVQ